MAQVYASALPSLLGCRAGPRAAEPVAAPRPYWVIPTWWLNTVYGLFLLIPAGLLTQTPWPKADPDLARDETVTVAVQVNGKLRGTLDLPRDTPAAEAEAAALVLPSVTAQLAGKPPRKVVVVPNRIINVVA